MKKINILFCTDILFCVAGLVIIIFVTFFISFPTTKAYFSYSTGECTKLIRIVEGKEKECDCSTLKETEKYERVWVK